MVKNITKRFLKKEIKSIITRSIPKNGNNTTSKVNKKVKKTEEVIKNVNEEK